MAMMEMVFRVQNRHTSSNNIPFQTKVARNVHANENKTLPTMLFVAAKQEQSLTARRSQVPNLRVNVIKSSLKCRLK